MNFWNKESTLWKNSTAIQLYWDVQDKSKTTLCQSEWGKIVSVFR